MALLRLNVLALSQRSIYFRSLLTWNSGIVAAENVTLVSSAYILGDSTFKQFGRSLIDQRNKRADYSPLRYATI